MLISILRQFHKTGLRGSNRATILLAKKIKSLQSLPLSTADGDVYVDLRITTAHRFLKNPDNIGEDLVMKRIVKSGDVVYDIGANFGIYTLLLSNIVGSNGKVYAFEPNREILKNLELTVNQKSNVELMPIALSDTEGQATLFVPEDVSMASLGNWTKEGKFGGEIHETFCEMRRLDDLIQTGTLAFPQFIKCDVEGAELSVVRGGVSVFNRVDAPIFMFEVNSDAASGLNNNLTISEFLDSLPLPRYSYFEILENGELKKTNSTDFHWTNVLAVPAAKLGSIKLN
jgi:FkbM family methyltransferase